MHLFRSQWLQEQGHRAEAPAYGKPTFGPRYGRHPAVSQHPCTTYAPPRRDDAAIGDFQAEREILREMACYDRAA